VYEAISQMKNIKTPGPNMFLVEFYHKFWEVLKGDMRAMFRELQQWEVSSFQLNFGDITLLHIKG
jgi:hypothetical protein